MPCNEGSKTLMATTLFIMYVAGPVDAAHAACRKDGFDHVTLGKNGFYSWRQALFELGRIFDDAGFEVDNMRPLVMNISVCATPFGL